MFDSRTIVLTSALLLPYCLAQSTTFTYGSSGCQNGLLSDDGHCCPGSIINGGQSSAICCAGDPKYDLINSNNININIVGSFSGNGMDIGNTVRGPSTCTAGTSTALTALPSTASGNSGSSASQTGSASTTTSTMGSQVCVTSTDASGDTRQECQGTGDQGSSTTTASGSGNTIVSGASSGGDSGSSSSPSSSSSHNAGWRPAATAAPLLAGVMAGAVALL